MRFLSFVAIGLLIVGCGGGGGDSPSPAPAAAPAPVTPSPPPPAADADFGGIWIGTLTYADQTFDDVLALTTAGGKFALIAADTFGPGTVSQYAGTATLAGSRVTGTGTAYAEAGAVFPGGGAVLPISLDATLVERLTLDGQLALGAVLNARLELEYVRELHETDSSLALLTGVWYVYDDLLNPMITFTFERDGRLLGQNANGCQSSGQVSIIDPNYNVYAWEATLSNCPIGGTFSGLGVLVNLAGDLAAPPDAFLVAVTNGTGAILLPLER